MTYMEHINLTLPAELLDQIDRERGDVPRTVWIRRAIEQRLNPGNYYVGPDLKVTQGPNTR